MTDNKNFLNMSSLFTKCLLLSLLLITQPALAADAGNTTIKTHALAMHGAPKYPPDFKHFDYVNPDAPKNGKVVLAGIGSYNSLNNFISKGVSADQLHLLYDTLTERSKDEPFTEYGLLAETIELPADRSYVTFHLNPAARFHDGKPVTAEDVVFTFHLLIDKGYPFYKAYYNDVKEVIAVNERSVKFVFRNTQNRELPLILGQLPVLPKHFWKDKSFTDNLLDIPMGSGPYKIKDFQTGQTITYERNKDYWAINHPINKGRYNFEEVRVEYFLDANVALEGLKSGTFDFYEENSSKRWATLYEGENFDNGTLTKEEIHHENPTGMQAFVFNTRREIFSDPRVRQALNYAFDFEWTNKNLFYGAYKRTDSYFENSELAASGLPDKAELALLEPHREDLPEEVFTQVYEPPVTDGDGNIRKQLREALKLLKDAGWGFENKRLIHKETGKPFQFEILLVSKDFERIVLPFIKNLEKLGIQVTPRLVDQSQYIERVRNFDFDMIIGSFRQSSSPGNEQRDYWYSGFADQKGSRNYIGVKDPVVDDLINKVIAADTREDLITATRALDRVLLWSHYVIPQWHIDSYRVAYKQKLQRPETTPKYDLGFYTWWIKPE
ncbi:MAG: extracellular solute-binding protein [Ketobacteraceae bacterium]|nr:extracellular solute-binding protein [Ketobacteraceae bacterium]